jgi:hypothetical protein
MKRALANYHGKQGQKALLDFQQVAKQENTNIKAHFYIGKLLAQGIDNRESCKEDTILHFEQAAKFPEISEFYSGNALF